LLRQVSNWIPVHKYWNFYHDDGNDVDNYKYDDYDYDSGGTDDDSDDDDDVSDDDDDM